MPPVRGVRPRSQGSNSQSTQSLLQHYYLIAAVAALFGLAALRVVMLRRRNRALSDFFRVRRTAQYSYGPDPDHPSDTSYRSMYHGIQLAPLPAAYHRDRRVRAADTDAHGRRLDLTGENWDGKDALPAYDNIDRPPKYVEAGWIPGGPPLPTELPSAVTPSPEGEQSGMAHSNDIMPHHDLPSS